MKSIVITKFLFVVFTAIILICVLSCNTEKITVPELSQFELVVITTSSNVSTLNGRVVSTNDLQFNSGFITIREIVFDGDLAGGNSVSITHEQIAVIDYATGTITPEIFIEVTSGTYTSVNLGIELQDDGAEPSMVLEGIYTNSDDVVIPIRFEFNSGEVFEANANSVTIEGNTDLIAKITFDALDWFSVIGASELDEAIQTNGIIIISETLNSDIFDAVADRLDVGTEIIFE